MKVHSFKPEINRTEQVVTTTSSVKRHRIELTRKDLIAILSEYSLKLSKGNKHIPPFTEGQVVPEYSGDFSFTIEELEYTRQFGPETFLAV